MAAHLSLDEAEVARLVLEFLANRELSISQLALERESGIINGAYSDDLLFLRQLILDGQWDDALDFVQPLEDVEAFDAKKFRFILLKHKFLELLCIRSEAGLLQSADLGVEDMVACLSALEQCSPSKEEYNELCLLLTFPRLCDHLDYKHWNPSNARVNCFKEVCPLVEKFLPAPVKSPASVQKASTGDRLMQLLIKGILYESCVDFCQKRATSTPPTLSFTDLLSGSDADLSLLSWLRCLPPEVFSYPFEQTVLNVDVRQLEKPFLEASWTEQILATPIKPRVFPHSAVPRTPMSRSLMMASMEGSIGGLAAGKMALSMADLTASMTRSFGSAFHLTGKKVMHTSVDKLFEAGDAFSTSCIDVRTDATKNFLREEDEEECVNEGENREGSGDVGGNKDGVSEFWKEFQRLKNDLRPRLNALATVSFHQEDYVPKTPPREEKVVRLITSTPRDKCVSAEAAQQGASLNSVDSYQHSTNMSMQSGPRSSLQKSQSPRTTPPPPPSAGAARVVINTYSPNHSATANHQGSSHHGGAHVDEEDGSRKPRFMQVTNLEDAQVVRAADFHPSGQFYAVGSNSKTLRICGYPTVTDLREGDIAHQPTVLFKRLKHHKGSIYCLAFNQTGDLLATGSNDKTVKLMRFKSETCSLEGNEAELTMHDGTIRDVCFIEDLSNRSSLLISGGAGDCKIYVTDCETATAFQALSGHSGHILSLYTWGGAMFVSGAQDRTIRFWDLRTRGCVNLVTAPPASGSGPGSPVAGVSVDPSGRMLVSGHEDAMCMLYDIRGGRTIQCFRPHASDVRSVRFSPRAYYLLTASYDRKCILTDLQGDLTQPLPSIVVAEHADKVIQARWHPNDFSFITTSADKTAVLWALPVN
ncbi:WD repeat-containing protein 47-like [Ornithodoros turicata]|uniref:WD repeat-containing protein 47-like n=1 Tax=Ornithodoros turicata TaxID=34597 RepID=UPI00313A07AD